MGTSFDIIVHSDDPAVFGDHGLPVGGDSDWYENVKTQVSNYLEFNVLSVTLVARADKVVLDHKDVPLNYVLKSRRDRSNVWVAP